MHVQRQVWKSWGYTDLDAALTSGEVVWEERVKLPKKRLTKPQGAELAGKIVEFVDRKLTA